MDPFPLPPFNPPRRGMRHITYDRTLRSKVPFFHFIVCMYFGVKKKKKKKNKWRKPKKRKKIYIYIYIREETNGGKKEKEKSKTHKNFYGLSRVKIKKKKKKGRQDGAQGKGHRCVNIHPSCVVRHDFQTSPEKKRKSFSELLMRSVRNGVWTNYVKKTRIFEMYFREFGERPAGSHGSLVAYTLGLGDVCSRWTQTRGATAGRKKKKNPCTMYV